MEEFVFCFGFCTPEQEELNEANGWDDENSGAFVVRAASRDFAIRWARTVVDAYLRHLYEESGRLQEKQWSDSSFADWIEEAPLEVFGEEAMRKLLVVDDGHIPNFENWIP